MAEFFKRHPLSALIGYVSAALVVLVTLRSSGILTGPALHWVEVAAGVLNVILLAYARMQVTPVIDPVDNQGRQLVPRPGSPVR